jgi:hypothetical protein
LRKELMEKEKQIRYFLNSKSWKVTAPLRWLYKKIKKNENP